MLQLGNSAATNGIKTALVRFLKTVIPKLFSQEAVDSAMSEYLDCCIMSDKSINAVVKRIMSKITFIRSVAGFIKRNVDSSLDDFPLSQISAVSEILENAGILLPSSRSSPDATEKPKNMYERERSKNRRNNYEKGSLQTSRSPNRSMSDKSSSNSRGSPELKDQKLERSCRARSSLSQRHHVYRSKAPAVKMKRHDNHLRK